MKNVENKILKYDTPESFLGLNKKRYFSSNYKKIKYDIDELLIYDNSLLGNLNVQWPEVWSEKNGGKRKPHLGSLELYIIAVQFVEYYMEIIDNLKKECLERVWVNNFISKVGNGCIEECENMACKCTKLSQKKSGCHVDCLFEIKIGKAIVRLAINYVSCENRVCLSTCNGNAVISLDKISNMKKRGELSFYSLGYKILMHKITNVVVNKEERFIEADIELVNEELSAYFEGISRTYQPCITFCDIIPITGQLSQILLFSLDDISREDAGNLWMRTADCKYFRPIKGQTKVRITVKESSIINTVGINYRAATLLLDYNGGDSLSECKFAYQLNY